MSASEMIFFDLNQNRFSNLFLDKKVGFLNSSAVGGQIFSEYTGRNNNLPFLATNCTDSEDFLIKPELYSFISVKRSSAKLNLRLVFIRMYLRVGKSEISSKTPVVIRIAEGIPRREAAEFYTKNT